ncbi:hypothetical protein SAMN05920897_101318 [Alkalispirochaeta americana]|uniref:Uncharacterized protein n=1 Tax=Alkalispirochaeta americana TaxID=159291 RepID=A0A1N6NLP7_9SPIO|nr:hypothetical protein [Alkalispirochaeta americana]SIP92971.1 hypothetical protein SAMN05920897_101318 [Alkalispirochaeta americana]
MDPKELESWIETNEGAAWLNGLKAPLLAKRDELLAKNRELSERLTEATQKVNDTSGLLQAERDAIRSTLVNREIDGFVSRNVVPTMSEVARTMLSSRIDAEVKADGQHREPHVSKETAKDFLLENEESISLREYLTRWSSSEEAKNFLLAPHNSGGGARGSSTTFREFDDADVSEFRKAMGLKD